MSKDNSIAYFTICSRNYLPTAKVLLSSLRDNTEKDIYIFICDSGHHSKKINKFLEGLNVKVVNVQDMNISNFDDFIFRYSILEINTAIKPFAFDYLSKKYQKIFYFDPDIAVDSSTQEIESLLDENDAILTPHITSPYRDRKNPNINDITNSGVYNLGFLGLKPSGAKNFLDWWKDKCRYQCYSDIDNNLFTDQRFCDYIPSFVAKTYIHKCPSANIAYWNLHERNISFKDGKYYSNKKEAFFFHFSGLVHDSNYLFKKLSKHENRFKGNIGKGLLKRINCYLKEIRENFELFESIGISDEYHLNKIKDVELSYAHRAYIREIERRYGALDFSDIDDEWFIGMSHEINEYSQIPRALMGVYLEREDIRNVFDLSSQENLNNFYRWSINAVKNTELPSSFYKYIPEESSISKKYFINKKSIYNFLLITSNRYTFLKNDFFKRPRNFVRNLLIPANSSTKNISSNFYLFQKTGYKVNELFGVNLFGYFEANTGVAKGVKLMNKMLLLNKLQISKYDINIDDNSIINRIDQSKKVYDISLFHINADQTPNCIPYVSTQLKNTYKIGYWAWELERFPSNYLKSGRYLNDLWVPSSFIANSIERSCDFSPKIVPHPVMNHPKGYYNVDKKFNVDKNKFIVTSAFDLNSYSSRKNPVASVKAFQLASKHNKEFASNASLILKLSGSLNKKNIISEINNIKEENKLDIKIIDSLLTESQMSGLRNLTDVFISLHRSEGFGLNLVENMSAGNLVIATNYSGNIDFMNNSNSLLVDYKLIPLRKNDYPEYHGQFWADPDINDACEKLLWSFENVEKSSALGIEARNFISKNYSIESISKTVQKHLADISL